MKRIFISCLLGISLLLPSIAAKSNTINAKSKTIGFSRIINVAVEGYVLFSNSDSKSGSIYRVEIYNESMQLVLVQNCSGYKVAVDLSSLPSGNYEAAVYAAHDQKMMPFNL
ncbi:MAG: hypothetical protein JWO06_4093 [Bacteroidota bacterium]|nr:hypothetical protein [Bacteroidota bacterium]